MDRKPLDIVAEAVSLAIKGKGVTLSVEETAAAIMAVLSALHKRAEESLALNEQVGPGAQQALLDSQQFCVMTYVVNLLAELIAARSGILN